MPSLSPSLRKAAVLLSSLDAPAADAILAQMSAEDAAKVRSAMMELDEIPADEQQRVLTDFLRDQSPAADKDQGVELLLDPALEQHADILPFKRPAVSESQDDTSLAFLEQVSPAAIADVLRNEHPQTAAVVISHLPPGQAAAVLEQLPAALATDALERIASIDCIASEVLAELARGLRRQLAPHLRVAVAGSASMSHVTAVLQAMDFRQRQRMLLQLGQRNMSLLKCLGLFPTLVTASTEQHPTAAPRYRIESVAAPVAPAEPVAEVTSTTTEETSEQSWLTFDDFLSLDDAALRSVLAAADLDLSLLALTGAEPRLIARILRKLPAKSAATLRQRLEHPGAVRIRDIDRAREALAAVANRLAHEGVIQVPASRRFAAAI